MRRRKSGRLARVVAFGAIAACAQPGMPPGGPPDDAPPALLAITPESGAVNVTARSVMLRFDEVVNERSTASAATGGSGGPASGGAFGASSGPPGLASVVILSPSDGRERVIWRRTAVEIEPRGGFRPNTAYRVTVLPGLSDLRGNRMTDRRELVFSTGGSIPTGEIHGVFFDWVAARATVGARIEVWRDADSTFRWITRSDSVGRYRVPDLEAGRYQVRGWLDGDNDRRIGVREVYEQATLELTDRAEADLYAFEHDTIGPRIEGVEFVDSTAIRIRFDHAVALTFVPDSNTITLFGSDSARIPLGIAVPAARYDSLARVSTAARDTTTRDTTVRDTTARDTTARDTTRVVAGVVPTGAPPATALMVLPQPQRPIPVTTWVAALGTPLAPGTYRLKAAGLPGLTGAIRASEREITKRPPAPPRDSTTVAPPTRPPGASR